VSDTDTVTTRPNLATGCRVNIFVVVLRLCFTFEIRWGKVFCAKFRRYDSSNKSAPVRSRCAPFENGADFQKAVKVHDVKDEWPASLRVTYSVRGGGGGWRVEGGREKTSEVTMWQDGAWGALYSSRVVCLIFGISSIFYCDLKYKNRIYQPILKT